MSRTAARCHLARLDRLAPARCQQRILLGLVHEAQSTRFGREHDFRRIRDAADFRRLVPLCTRAELWREYWQPVYPNLGDATWPRNGQAFHESDGSIVSHSAVSVSSLHAAHQRALWTALALVNRARPKARLLEGDLLVVSDEGPSSLTQQIGLRERSPTLTRPYARSTAEATLEQLADRSVSCLIGSIERIMPLVEELKQLRGVGSIQQVWPQLSAILYSRRSAGSSVDRLRAEAEGALLLETVGRAEGPIAVEDPRRGQMRLLFDHGVYFEFVPPGRTGELRGPRFGLDEVELGVPYELVVSSPAGLWACHIGRTVIIEGRQPPRVRFLELTVRQPVAIGGARRPRRTDLILPGPTLPEPHPQSDGSPAELPGSSVHNPWSILADRG